jgi:hypothetical protein
MPLLSSLAPPIFTVLDRQLSWRSVALRGGTYSISAGIVKNTSRSVSAAVVNELVAGARSKRAQTVSIDKAPYIPQQTHSPESRSSAKKRKGWLVFDPCLIGSAARTIAALALDNHHHARSMPWKQVLPLRMKLLRMRHSPAMAAIAISRRTKGITGNVDVPNGSSRSRTTPRTARYKAGIKNAASSTDARTLLRVWRMRFHGTFPFSHSNPLDTPRKGLFLTARNS